MNQNYIHDEMKSRTRWRDVCYQLVQSLWSSIYQKPRLKYTKLNSTRPLTWVWNLVFYPKVLRSIF